MFSLSVPQAWNLYSTESLQNLFKNLVHRKDDRFMVLKSLEPADPSQYPRPQAIPNWQLIISEHILALLTNRDSLNCFKSEPICKAMAIQLRWKRTRSLPSHWQPHWGGSFTPGPGAGVQKNQMHKNKHVHKAPSDSTMEQRQSSHTRKECFFEVLRFM